MSQIVKTALLSLALSAATATFAQTPSQQPDSQTTQQPGYATRHQPDPAKEAKHLSKQLGLSADQTSQVQSVFADREQRIQSLMASNPDQKTMRQQRRTIMQDERTRINAILTPAQQQQWASMQSERRQHGAPGAQNGASTPPPSLG